MARGQKDVELVIKATDQASKSLQDIAKNLNAITDAQKAFTSSASGVDQATNRLTGEMESLAKTAAGLEAFREAAKSIDEAGEAVKRMDANVQTAKTATAQLLDEYGRIGQRTQELRTQLDAAQKAFDDQSKKATNAARELREIDKATNSAGRNYQKLAMAIELAEEPTQDMQFLLAAQAQTYRTLQAAQAQARAAHEREQQALLETKNTLAQTNVAYQESNKHQQQFRREVEATVTATTKQRQELSSVTREYTNLAGAAARTGAALGGIAADQNAITAASTRAAQQLKQVGVELERVKRGSVWTQAVRSLRTYAYETRRQSAEQKAANAEQRNAMALQRTSLNLYQRVRGQILSMTAAYVGLFGAMRGINQVIDAFQAVEAVQNRLGAALGQNTTVIAREMKFLRQEAVRLGIGFSTLGDQYSKFTVATQAGGFELEASRDIFLAVAEAARVNKLSLDQTASTFLALEQMVSKGKVSMEELRRQLGNALPGAFQLFARALGKTTQELDRAVAAGEVFADQQTLLKFAAELRRTFGAQLPTALQSLTTQFGVLGANLNELRIQVSEGGFAEILRQSIVKLNKALQGDLGEALVKNLSYAMTALANGIKFVVENIDALIMVTKALIALRLGAWMSTVVQRAREASASMGLFATQMVVTESKSRAARVGVAALNVSIKGLAATANLGATAFRAFWAALGGWVGIGITAAIAVVSHLFSTAVDGAHEASEAIDRHKNHVQGLREAYLDAGEATDKWRKAVENMSVTQLQADLQTATKRLQEFRQGAKLASSDWLGPGMGGPNGPLAQVGRQIEEVNKGFRAGRLTADEYKKTLEGIAKANPDFDKNVIAKLQDIADQAKESEIEIARFGASIKIGMGQDLTDAEKSLLGLVRHLDDLKSSVRDTAAYDKWRETFSEIKELIPELSNEMGRLKAQAKLDALVNQLKELGPLSKETLDIIAKARKAIDSDYADKEAARLNKLNAEANKAAKKAQDEANRRKKASEDYLESIKDQNEELQFQIKNLQETGRQQAINAALFRADRAAEKAYVDTTTEAYRTQRAVLEELTGALYDKQEAARNAQKEEAKHEKEVNKLGERRLKIMEQITFYEERGEDSRAATLRDRLEQVNAEYEKAIDAAIAFWAASTSEDAENAILNLQQLKAEIAGVGEQSIMSAKDINDSFANFGGEALTSFVDDIVAGEDAFENLGVASRKFFATLLSDIAKAIIQATILKSLTGSAFGGTGGIGGTIVGWLSGLQFHSGGIVGAGGTARLVSPDWFSNATRYHSGGIAGMAPNEVPAILERGEEVLTANDPRHQNNTGAQSIKVVNTFDAGSFVSEGLASPDGQRALLNFVSANKSKFKTMLGG